MRRTSTPSTRSFFLAIAGCVAPAASLALTAPATALDIVLDYRERRSEPPVTDPDGLRLQFLMERAAEAWEDIFKDYSRTVRINYFYEDRRCRGLFGEFGLGAICGNLAVEDRAPLTSGDVRRIRVNANVDWYYDVGGTFGEDFRLESTFQNTGAPFGGLWPLWTETLYSGPLTDTAITGDVFDLYTVLLHEIGHSLGMAPCPGGEGSVLPILDDWLDAWQDGPWFVTYAEAEPGGASDCGHLAVESLMSPALPPRARREIAMIDVLAIASRNDWEITGDERPYLPRMDMGRQVSEDSNIIWNDTILRWFGERPPTDGADGFIRDPSLETVTATVPHEVSNLWIGDERFSGSAPLTVHFEPSSGLMAEFVGISPRRDMDTDVIVDGCTLETNELCLFSGDAGDAELRIQGGGALVTHTMTNLEFGSHVLCSGSSVAPIFWDALGNGVTLFPGATVSMSWTGVDASIIRLDAGSLLAGGSSEIRGFVNNFGEIRAQNGDLFLTGSDDAPAIDLDGIPATSPEQGILTAVDGRIIVTEAVLTDAFDGMATVGDQLIFEQPWTLGPHGTVRFQTPYPIVPLLASASTNVRGRIVCVALEAVISGGLTLEAEGELEALGGTVIRREGISTQYAGGAVIGDGTLIDACDKIVVDDQRIDVANYVWDGETADGGPVDFTTQIVGGAKFRITSPSLGFETPADGYDGTIIVTFGELEVDSTWRLDGTLDMTGAKIRGGALGNFGVIAGDGFIFSQVFNAGLIVGPPVGSGDALILDGGLVNLGGTISGNVIINDP